MQVILLFLLLCFSIYGKDPQILIEGCVDVESGALILKSEDHFLKPYTELVLYGTPQDKTQYVYTTVDVSDYTYQLQDDNPQLIRIDPFTFKLITSEKTERIYRKAYVVDHNLHFLLQSETLQDGSVRTYEYDQHHKIRSIKCGQRSWQFHHGEAHLDVISNGDKATYEFDGPRLIKHPSFLIDYTDDGKVSELKSPSGEILEEFLYSPDQTEVLHKGGNKTRYEFGDPTSGARLTQVRFPVGVSQRNLTLTLSLPQRAGGSLPQTALDQPLPFYALVLNDEATDDLNARLRQVGTLEPGSPELASVVDGLDAGMVRLELIPRGIGRVEMRAPNLYHEIFPGDEVSMEVTLRNIGSRRLDSLRLLTETPLGWQGRVVPDLVTALDVDGETVVQLTFSPPDDVPVGDYQMRIRAESAAAERRVESQETTVRVHVAAPANLWLTGTLALLLITLVAGIVIFGIKLTSR